VIIIADAINYPTAKGLLADFGEAAIAEL